MKSLCVLAKKPGTSREEFQSYYENHHAPLAISHFPFQRYARNYLIDSPDIGFDVISEFWSDDTGALNELMAGPIGDTMREDEERFMDRAKIAPAGSDEEVLSNATSGETADNTRYALLLNWEGGDERVSGWIRSLSAHTPDVSVDRLTSWSEPSFPARSVVWTPSIERLDTPPTSVEVRTLKVRRYTTPEALLQQP